MKGKFFSKKFFTLVILLLLAFGFGAYFRESLRPTSSGVGEQTVEFWVKQGDDINQVAEVLKATGLVKSKILFEFYGLLTGGAFLLQPGLHYISSAQSASEILDKLSSKPSEVALTVFPGLTLKEVEERLVAIKVISKGELANFNPALFKKSYPFLAGAVSLEGFIMPDTYKFFAYSSVDGVVKKFLDNFQAKTKDLKDSKGLTFLERKDILEKLVVASLLEKEIPDIAERQIAAGILEKRLKNDIPLQVDATIFYFKCEGKFLGCGNVVRKDYKKPSPFNTYLNKGLPPAPISNPGAEAIKAAVNPVYSNYWYYLSDPKTKRTIFSSTFDEHNENRYKYLKM